MLKTRQKRLRKSKVNNIYWCPRGHGPIGDTDLCFETKYNDRSVHSKPVLTRAYYLCPMCKAEFDLKETHKGYWEYKPEESK